MVSASGRLQCNRQYGVEFINTIKCSRGTLSIPEPHIESLQHCHDTGSLDLQRMPRRRGRHLGFRSRGGLQQGQPGGDLVRRLVKVRVASNGLVRVRARQAEPHVPAVSGGRLPWSAALATASWAAGTAAAASAATLALQIGGEGSAEEAGL